MLKRLEIVGFKSFAKKTVLDFSSAITAVVGPNGSGKSNVAEAFSFALGEQSMKSMRSKRAEDLIWNGSHSMPRANRASVAIVFDNSRRMFSAGGGSALGGKVDFDEVVIERVAFRDGTSEYSINGSRVRLRDIAELLAGANIGETGHHIISQGESDRILLASPRERRAILEDALGLKLYEFKKQEAEKKLEKTEGNIAQVNSLRRELSPHLHFLEGQVKKLERADTLRKELVNTAQTYFAIEDAYLAREKIKVAGEKKKAGEHLAIVTAELSAIEEHATTDAEGAERLALVRKAEHAVERISNERGTLARNIGRVEGALSAAEEMSELAASEPYVKVPREDVAALAREVRRQVEEAKASDSSDTAAVITALIAALSAIGNAVKSFVDRFIKPADDFLVDEDRTAYALENEKTDLLAKDAKFAEELERTRAALASAREALTAHDETNREQRRRILDFAQAKAHEEGEVAKAKAREYELSVFAEELERNKMEVRAIGGPAALSYRPLAQLPAEERKMQEERKRSLERMKVRLEEAGDSGEDIRHEYKEVSQREAFLAFELEDLAKSAAGLNALIDDLNTELSKYFSEGLAKVNASFSEYFSLMFGGGSARLILEEPEELEAEESEELEESESKMQKEKERPGIEIVVNLPKKKLHSLVQLSGGERALTSIALIFAMSQVNPPPFLILDETDAALDEANSRRYGDIVENLSKRSQLIIITHNRETMSRTNILYGVTMGADGVSKLLSVKFDEAVAVAK